MDQNAPKTLSMRRNSHQNKQQTYIVKTENMNVATIEFKLLRDQVFLVDESLQER